MPIATIPQDLLERGIPITALLVRLKLAANLEEAEELVDSGQVCLNGIVLQSKELVVSTRHLLGGKIVLRAGTQDMDVMVE